jgi:hypothetical protein
MHALLPRTQYRSVLTTKEARELQAAEESASGAVQVPAALDMDEQIGARLLFCGDSAAIAAA